MKSLGGGKKLLDPPPESSYILIIETQTEGTCTMAIDFDTRVAPLTTAEFRALPAAV